MSNWKEIQQKTFTNWFNDRLRGNLKVAKAKVNNLETDLADGLLLITLLENLAKPRKVGRYNKNPISRIQCIENLGQALKFIKSENIKLVNIGPEDISGCNLKLILGLVWTLIGHFQIRSSGKGLSTKQAMKEWLHTLIPDYNIQNFNTNWNDGRAVCALVDRLKPGSCPNHVSLNPANGLENCRRGMTLAEETLEVPMVLDPEDLHNPDVDDLSVMTYISYFFEPASKSLLEWIRLKIPQQNVTNLSTDWNNGINLAALMEACHKGLVPEWSDMDPHKAFDNLDTCIKLAKDRLDILCPVGPGALSDPSVDEIIVATYLARFRYSQLTANPEEMSIEPPEFSENNAGLVKEPIEISLNLGTSPDLALEQLSVTAEGPTAAAVVTIEGVEDAKAKFIPLEPGLYKFNCLMNGTEVEGSPLMIPIIDPSSWSVTGDVPVPMLIDSTVELYVKGESFGSSPLTEVQVSPNGIVDASLWEMESGTFQLTLTPLQAGKASVTVTVAKINIQKSPVLLSICDPSICTINGLDDNKIVSLEEPVSFEIDTSKCGQNVKPQVLVNGPTNTCTPKIEPSSDNPSKYFVTIIPEEPGPHDIRIKVLDNEVPGCPFTFTVLEPDPTLDPTLCSARGPGLVKAIAGKPARFGIITPEQGLLEKDPNALTVEVFSADRTTKVTPSIIDLQNKTYGVTYTVPIEGEYLIRVNIYREPIPGCDFKINALPKPDPAKCRVYGPALHPNALLLSGRPLDLYVDVKNAGTGELQAVVQGPKSTTPKIFVSEEDNTYSLRVDADRPGWYRINIWWGQVHIPDSPIDLKVHQAPDASKVKVFGPGVSREIEAHRPAEFFIDTQEAGIGTLTVVLHGVKDAFDVDVKPENPINPRLLKGVYQPREGGDYEVTVMWSDVEVPGSPFKVKVVDRESEWAEKEKERELEREREKEKERKEKKRRQQKEKLRQQRLMYMNAGGYPGIMSPTGGVVNPTYMNPSGGVVTPNFVSPTGGVVSPTYISNGGLVSTGNPTIMGMMGGAIEGGGGVTTTKRTTVQSQARRSHQAKLVRRSTDVGGLINETSTSSQSDMQRKSKAASLSRSQTAPAFSNKSLKMAATSFNTIDSEPIALQEGKPTGGKSNKRKPKLSRSSTQPSLVNDELLTQRTSKGMKKSSSYRGTSESLEPKKPRSSILKQQSLSSIEVAMARNAGKLGDVTPIGGKMTANWAKLYNVTENENESVKPTPSPSPPRLKKLERRVSFSSDGQLPGSVSSDKKSNPSKASNFNFRSEEDIPTEEPVKYTPVYVATGEIPLDLYDRDNDSGEDVKGKKKKGKKKKTK